MRRLCGEALENQQARLTVTAERAFLAAMGGGWCFVKIAAYGLQAEPPDPTFARRGGWLGRTFLLRIVIAFGRCLPIPSR